MPRALCSGVNPVVVHNGEPRHACGAFGMAQCQRHERQTDRSRDVDSRVAHRLRRGGKLFGGELRVEDDP
jgi:hypothetical protein